MINKKNVQLEFLISAFLLLIVYWGNLFNPNVPSLDQEDLLKPLLKVATISDYIELVKENRVYDVQPVRDFSHIADIWITRKIGIYTAILHNLLLFIISGYFLYLILLNYFEKKVAFPIITLYLLHPVFTSVIYFETARKHLLSFFFTTILIYLFHKYDKLTKNQKLFSLLLYLLAGFSQPINFLVPLVLFPLKVKKENINKTLLSTFKDLIPYFIIMGFIGCLNLYYYNVIFLEQSGVPKLPVMEDDNRLLAIGRMFYQFLVPSHYSTFYNAGSLNGLVGLYGLVGFIFLSIKFVRKQILYPFATIYLTVLIILYHKQANIFYLDTYILTPSLFYLFCLTDLLKNWNVKIRGVITFVLGCYFAFVSISEVKLKKNFDNYILTKFPQEPTCQAIMGYSQTLYNKKEFDKLREAGKYWIEQECSWINKHTYILQVFYLSLFVYLSEDLTLEEKKNLFEQRPEKDGNTVRIFLELIKMQMNNTESAENILKIFEEIKNSGEEFCVTIERNFLVSESIKFCTFDNQGCHELKRFLNENQCSEKQGKRQHLYAK